MKSLRAALFLFSAACLGAQVSAKETCTHTWAKGNYKTFKQVQDELQERVGNGKILRFSLCGNTNDHYFQVTILEPSGKVLVVHLAAQ